MKRFLAFLLAAMLMLPFCLSALAVNSGNYFSIYTGDSSKTYNPDRRVTVSLSLRDISFGMTDCVSALEFVLYYDKNMLTPVNIAAGGEGDCTGLLSEQPGDWEGFAVVDEKAGKISFAFSDMTGAGVTADDSIVIKVPFQTKQTARVNDIVFRFDDVRAYNRNMESYHEINVGNVTVVYAAQPAVNAEVPSGAVPLNVAGYRNDTINFIYYSKNGTTVSDFVKKYSETNYNQNRLNSFAVIVAGIDGIITYVDTTVGTMGNKSNVRIPAGSYIIGVNKANTSDYNYVKSKAKVGAQITVYNVNIEGAGNGDLATDLSRAAFTIHAVGTEPPFVGGNDPGGDTSGDGNTSNGGTTSNGGGNTSNSGTTSNDGSSFLLGDVNMNGSIDMTDYIMVKRAYFGTYELTSAQKKRGDCNKNGNIDMTDYIMLKRAYFGTYDLNG